MKDDDADKLATGLERAGYHIGSGLGWLGFWLFLGLCSLDIIQAAI